MDHHVNKQASRYLNVGNRRRCWISGSNSNHIWISNFTVLNHLPHPTEIVVKTAVEPDLANYTRRLNRFHNLMDTDQTQINRFFQENLFSCFGRRNGNFSMSIGRGCNNNGFNFRICQKLVVIVINIFYPLFFGPGT